MTETQQEFINAASEETIQKTAERMRERNFTVLIVDNAAEARQAVLERVPAGAQVHSAKSKTLVEAGISEDIYDPNKYDHLRHQFIKMDRKTQAHEIRRLIGAPDYELGSLNAVTEDGVLLEASATSGQIGPYANTAGKVILVVGSQKIVPDLETALRRIREYVLPWEDEQVFKAVNIHSYIGKILIIEREWIAERITVILVREPIGI